jgi:hypothetical protein
MARKVDPEVARDAPVVLAANERSSIVYKPKDTHTSMRPLGWAAVFAALLLTAILFQWLGRAYSSEFSGADESAHFITGLMIRDYVANGFPDSPMKFAEDYYVHYPKVAFGMWGPLLHMTEAAWTLVFPPTRVSLLVLMAIISASAAFLLCLALVEEFGAVLAIGAGFLFLCMSPVQHHTGMIMADILVAVMDLCAAMAFGRYLNTRDWKSAIWFGVFVSLSILAKGNGVALVFLPAFAILFGRYWDILKEKPFWTSVVIIGCIAGPWQYYSARALMGIHLRPPAGAFVSGYTWMTITFLGGALVPVVAAGVYDRLILPAWRRTLDGKWASAGALICSVWALHSIIADNGVDRRYLIAILPPLLMFLMAGIVAIADWTKFLPIAEPRRLGGIAAIVAVVFLICNFSLPQKRYFGFDEVAERLESPQYKNSIILVSTDAQDGEGMLISEIAMREKRPSHIVLRATKMLSQSDWMGQRYKLLYKTPEEVMSFLEELPVEIVVIQIGAGPMEYPDHALLRQAIDRNPAQWEEIGTFPLRRVPEPGSRIEVFRLKSAVSRTARQLHIELPFTLKHSIETSIGPGISPASHSQNSTLSR